MTPIHKLVVAIATVSILATSVPAAAQTVIDLDSGDGLTAEAIADTLIGGGVSISNVTYTGAPRAVGIVTGATEGVGFDSGIVLSSGNVQSREADPECGGGVEGPNLCFEQSSAGGATSTALGTPGDVELDGLAGFPTLDASVLEFDFLPQFATIQFRYVFSSEEYNDFVNTQFNDVFAFYVNGVNCALVPGTTAPVSINTINDGNPLGDATATNPGFFRDNVRPAPSLPLELDGLTTILTCDAQVEAGALNHMKLAIADASDRFLDSAVFIEAGSFVSGTSIQTELSGGGQTGASIEVTAGTPVVDAAVLMGVNAATATGAVHYAVYSDDACTTLHADAGTVAVSGALVPSSEEVVFEEPGVYYWVATYSGDDVNNPSESGCGDEVVVVTAPPPPPGTSSCKVWYHGSTGSPWAKIAKVRGFAWGRHGKVLGDHGYKLLSKWHHLHVDSIRSESLSCTDTTATIVGVARVKHRRVRFQIDLVDGGKGKGTDRYRLRLDNGLDTGDQPLRHGHVLIHPR